MTLEEALEKSGTANLVDDKTLQATKELIEPDEEILYALYTKVGVNDRFDLGLSENSPKKGIIVIAKNKVLFSGELIREINETKETKTKDITNIEQEEGIALKGGYLNILSNDYKFRIKVADKKQLIDIKSAIRSAQNMIKGKE